MRARDAIDLWLRDGLLSHDQAAALRASLDEHERTSDPERTGGFVQLLSFVGAALVGAGLLAFIGGQWDEQSPARRILLILAVYGLIVATAAFAGNRQLTGVSRALWFLSTVAAGAVIFLIGQIFNLPLNWWLGTALWLLIALVAGWASPSLAHGALAVGLAILTLGWISTPSAEFFDQAAFLFDARGLRPLLGLLGLALVALALLVADTDFAFVGRPATGVGVGLVAVPLIVSTFAPETFALVFEIDLRVFHVVTAVMLVGLVGAAAVRHPASPLAVAAAVVTVVWIVLLPSVDKVEQGEFFDHMDRVAWLAPVLLDSPVAMWLWSAVVFGLALGATELGRRYDMPVLVTVGFITMGVLLVTAYIARIAGALPTAAALLIGGVFVIAVAIGLERKRRDLLATVAP